MAKRKASENPSADDTAETRGSELVDAKAAEGYTVLARRYRPQQFSDLVGQEPVVQALVNALESNRVAHAYLFTGARGVGKTSTARILAKALNCTHGPTATPCGRCEICQSIASGEDVDVLEIDGASNRGIDEIREIRQNVQYRPSRSRHKIYIVDEVHMLTPAAFNALLKTLEEPPAHVKFIFATTEVQKIPITILSRCQRFDFAGIGTPRIVDRLREVVAAEGMQADDEALELVARRAQGSMRDAQSLLDQLLAFGGDRLTTDQVHQLLGTAHDDRVAQLAAAVLAHDAKEALELLRQAADAGLQLSEFVDQLMDYWRDLMLVNCGGIQVAGLNAPPRIRESVERQAGAMKLDTILAGLDVLSTTKARLRLSNQGRVLIEMALVRLSRLEDLAPLSQLVHWLNQPETKSDRGSRPSPSQAAAAPLARPPEAAGLADSVKKKVIAASEPAPVKTVQPLGPETLADIWQQVVNQCGPILAGQLKKAELPAISGPNTLVLRFGVSYNQERDHCQHQIGRIEEALKKVAGQGWCLRIESGGNAAVSSKPHAEDAENSQSRYRRQRTDAMKEPLVKRATEVLDAQIVDVEEGFGATPAERAEAADSEEA